MGKRITQRELRDAADEIVRALNRGESFVVTRNGVPVGELAPPRLRQFARADAVIEAFRGAPDIDGRRWRDDVSALLDEDPTPRA